MSATINIFDSAFNDNHRTIKVDSGLRIEEVENLDWENTLIYVNGFERKKEYKLRDGDVATLRQFPSNQGSSARNFWQGAGWLFMPVTSAITFFVTGSSKGAILAVGDTIDNAIHDALKQEPTDTTEIGQGEQLPTISGAKNRSGANQPIPLLLGQSLYTPITLAQSYTTLDGRDGENQIFHCLYVLGYKNIDVKEVKLGIYLLSDDEKDGTSGTISTANRLPLITERTIYVTPRRITPIDITPIGSGLATIKIKAVTESNNSAPSSASDLSTPRNNSISSVKSVESYELSAKAYSDSAGATSGTSLTVHNVDVSSPRTRDSATATHDGFSVTIDEPPSGTDHIELGYPNEYESDNDYIEAKADVVKTDISHYPYADSSTRKGYHQHLELQQGSSEVDLYPQKVVQENFGTELMHPEDVAPLYVQPFSAKYPQKVQIEIMFQNLVLYDDKGKPVTNSDANYVDICIGYSLDGGQTYLPFPAFPSQNRGSGTKAIEVSDQGTYTDGNATYQVTRFKGFKNKQLRYVAEKTFDFDTVFNIPNGTVKCKNNVVEFKIFRKTEDKSITDSKYQDKCFFSAIRTWCYDYKETLKQYEEHGTQSLVIQRPIVAKYRNMTARLGFEIRAGEELKGTIDELNVLMESRARYCTITESNGEKTYTWSGTGQQNPYAVAYTKPTNNPASLALMVLQHEMLGEYAYTDEQIDMESFGKFYEWCEQTDSELINSSGRKYVTNGVVSKQFKLIDLVNNILNCGHGKLVINGNKYGVVYDKPDIQPVMILNNQNVLEAKNTKNFLEDIDGYSCKFIDSLNDYQEDTQIFVPKDLTDPQSPNYKDPTTYKLESIELPYTTDVKRAYRFCMYLLACRKLRPESWERKLGVDGALVDVGSLVTVQDDTIVVGIGDGAQITEITEESGDIVSIDVDYGFNVTDTTKTYGVKIQHSDALNGVKILTYELASFETTGTKTTLVFAVPIDSSTVIKPAENDIVSFGLYEKITTDAICLGKKSNNDGTYTLTLVPYQNDIYTSERGIIPEFESNVTSPLDTGVEVAEELPPVTREDVGDIAEAVLEEGTDEPPSAPTGLSVIAEEHGIQIKWIPVEDNGINNTIKQYDVELTRDGGTTWIPFVSTYNSDAYYTFRRTASVPPVAGEYVDGYPEATDFANWQFRVKAVNIYGYESTWLTTGGNVNTQKYGTWVIPALSATQEILDRTAIVKVIHNAPQRPLYGSQRLQLKIKRLGSDDPTYAQQFNTMLAITPDIQWYTPNFNDLVGYSDTEDNEPNYRESGSGWYTTDLYQFSHTLPLIGQTPRIFKENDVPVLDSNDKSVFTKDVEDVTVVPSEPSEGDVIHFMGTSETLGTGFYYLYENSQWVQVFSKSNAVATTYQYLIQMTNESGNVTAMSEPVKVTVLPTNISDIVHSHEHYKDLYVEKLSAISANIGMISEGGMGDFENKLNYWALSNLSPDETGIAGGVKQGAFRVGGTDQYFKVEPDPNDPTKFNIELRAGSINLTSESDQNGFVNGTRIFNGDPATSLRSLLLTANGMLAQTRTYDSQTQKYNDWVTSSRVEIDEKDNLIITNADSVPDFGYEATGDIYHFDSDATKDKAEAGEGVTPTNPQGIVCDGNTVGNESLSVPPLLNVTSSPRSLSGTVTKNIQNFTGFIVFFSRADRIRIDNGAITVDGDYESNVPAPLIGYNEAMNETSTVRSDMTVGKYLGLSDEQIENGIFY